MRVRTVGFQGDNEKKFPDAAAVFGLLDQVMEGGHDPRRFATDLLVRAGAAVMFSENTEVRDAVDQLTARAASAATCRGRPAR